MSKLKKAKEDKFVPENLRSNFRAQKKSFAHDPLQAEITTEPGVSNTGIEVRRADPKKKGAVAHGYGRVTTPEKHKIMAVAQLKSKLQQIKDIPKPNLPKSELEKAVPKINPKDPILNEAIPPKAMNDEKRKEYESRVMKLVNCVKNKQPLKKSHEDIVVGIKVPRELKNHSEPVPYEHPDREKAVQFVTEVHRRNKAEGARVSEKYLGIAEGGIPTHRNAVSPERRNAFIPPHMKPTKAKEQYSSIKNDIKKSVKPQPASVSEPLIISRGTTTTPKTIDSPNTVNAYKSENSKVTGRVIELNGIIKNLKNKRGSNEQK